MFVLFDLVIVLFFCVIDLAVDFRSSHSGCGSESVSCSRSFFVEERFVFVEYCDGQ